MIFFCQRKREMFVVTEVKMGTTFMESIHVNVSSALNRKKELIALNHAIPQVYWVGSFYNEHDKNESQTVDVDIQGHVLQENGLVESIEEIEARVRVNNESKIERQMRDHKRKK